MTSSNGLLQKLADKDRDADEDPGFKLIVAFDYYDGPESGLALYPSGEGVYFTSLGDSKTRLFRAFELMPIEGEWWSRVSEVWRTVGPGTPERVFVVPESTQAVEGFEREVRDAAQTGQFVAVGGLSLETLSARAIAPEELKTLRDVSSRTSGFQLAYRMVKGREPGD